MALLLGRMMRAALMTLGAISITLAFMVSGPPRPYEVRALKDAAGALYVSALAHVEHAARDLRRDYCRGADAPGCETNRLAFS